MKHILAAVIILAVSAAAQATQLRQPARLPPVDVDRKENAPMATKSAEFGAAVGPSLASVQDQPGLPKVEAPRPIPRPIPSGVV